MPRRLSFSRAGREKAKKQLSNEEEDKGGETAPENQNSPQKSPATPLQTSHEGSPTNSPGQGSPIKGSPGKGTPKGGSPELGPPRGESPSPPRSPPQKERRGSFLNSAIKEIKRPLSSLLRRPGSRSGSRDRGEQKEDKTKTKSGSRERGEAKEEKGKRKDSNITTGVPEEIADGGETRGKKAPPSGVPKKTTGQWGNGDITTGERRRPGTATAGKKGGRPSTALSIRPGGGIAELPDGDIVPVDGPHQHIEDITGYEFGGDVAHAPTLALPRMQDFHDNKILAHPVFTSLDDCVDLSLLLRQLPPESETQDEGKAWTWDSLFTAVTSAIAAQKQDKTALLDAEHEPHIAAGI